MGNSPKLPVYENARQGTAIPFPPFHAVSCLAFFNSDCYTIFNSGCYTIASIIVFPSIVISLIPVSFFLLKLKLIIYPFFIW